MGDRELLTVEEAAEYLTVTKSALSHWRAHGKGPDYLKLGAAVRYSRTALDEWMDRCRVPGSVFDREAS